MMAHLTLNSGKCVCNAKRNLPPQLGIAVRSILDKGGDTFPSPYEAYRVETEVLETGVAFQFYKGADAVSFCVGTWSAEDALEYWAEIEKEFRSLTEVCPKLSWSVRPPKIPTTLPWLATLLLPDFFIQVKSDSPDVGFLNTCEFILFEVAWNRKHADARNRAG